MFHLFVRMALASLVVLSLTACDQSSDSNSPSIRTVFLHGDPNQLLSHVNQVQSDSLLASDQGFEFEEFSLVGGIRFAKMSPLLPAEGSGDPEAGNEANDGNASEGQYLQNFRVQQRAGQLLFANDYFAFMLEQRNGYYYFTKIPQLIWGGQDIEMIHYSVKPDRSVFTILFRILDDPNNPEIGAFYFAKQSPRSDQKLQPILADTRFNYLLGPGIGAPWRQQLVFSLCEPDADRAKRLEEGILAWDRFDQENGKIAGLDYRIERPDRIYPFTELSQNCLMFVDDYLFESQDEFAILGLTLPVINFNRYEYVKSHMFVSEKGLRKIDPTGQRIEQTIIHEVGHMLGLDHEFEKDEQTGQYKYPSVMGYGDIDYVTEHDQSAISGLYPESSSLRFQTQTGAPCTESEQILAKADKRAGFELLQPLSTPTPTCSIDDATRN